MLVGIYRLTFMYWLVFIGQRLYIGWYLQVNVYILVDIYRSTFIYWLIFTGQRFYIG